VLPVLRAKFNQSRGSSASRDCLPITLITCGFFHLANKVIKHGTRQNHYERLGKKKTTMRTAVTTHS
jgi:hypothetical protein